MIGGTKRMCEEFVLSNGLRVVAEPIENFPSVSVGLWIGAGSMYESAEENGLSHFVEHILFKSTERRTTKDIAVEMDALGGQVNAFTAKECTCYYAKVIAEHLPRAMDLLCDMLLNARVDEAEFEKERGVILEEIAMCEDTPEDLVYDLLAEAYFGEHPLARPILGSHEQIASISREALLAFKKKHYRPDNTVLAIAGQFDMAAFREMAERLLGGWHAEGETHIPAPVEGTTPRVLTRKKDIEQVHICLAFPGVEQDDEDLLPHQRDEQPVRRRHVLPAVPAHPRGDGRGVFRIQLPEHLHQLRHIHRVRGHVAGDGAAGRRRVAGSDSPASRRRRDAGGI